MSVNKVILLGNVATDPEVRYLEQNLPVASFRLATTERGRQNADGSRTPDRTEFHTIVAWRGLAEIAEKYIRKGSPIYVEGKLRTRQYNAADGSQRSVTEIVADSIECWAVAAPTHSNNPRKRQGCSTVTNRTRGSAWCARRW